MLSIRVIGDRQLITRLRLMPKKVELALRRKVTKLAMMLRNKVRQEKLSGQVLNVRTGDLRRSIREQVIVNPGSVVGRVFSSSDVSYGKVHEFGGKSAYDIVPVKKKVLRFIVGGKVVFAQKVRHPPAKARPFMRPALQEMRGVIEAGLKEAIREGLAK